MTDTPPDQDLLFQEPQEPSTQLMMLFHGYGGTPRDFLPLARRLRQAFPVAWIVGIAGPAPASHGVGRQWYGAQDVNEQNRMARVNAAMPLFLDSIQKWQARTGVAKNGLALIGFSQGGIMALESTQLDPAPAGRVIAIGSRFVQMPSKSPSETTLHLFHGKDDTVLPYRHTVEAAEHLVGLGADITADVIPGVGHQISSDIREQIVQRLRTHIPRRLWEEALRASGATG